MKKRLLTLMLLCTLTLTACRAPDAPAPLPTLPPAALDAAGPVGDAALLVEQTAALYLPSKDGHRLLCQYETLEISRGRHPAEAVARALLAHPGNDAVSPAGGGVAVQLTGNVPVEVACGVCTVNLSASALQLSDEAFYTLCQALGATLCALPDVTAVNVLVSGHAAALDVSGCLPLGCVTPHLTTELPVLWEQMSARRAPVGSDPALTSLTSAATLYFPLASGDGVTAEIRSLHFDGQTPGQLALGLLQALSSGAQTAPNAAAIPSLSALLLQPPQVAELSGGGRMLSLYFSAGLDQALRQANVDAACLIASLALTMTTYIPEVEAVRIYTGDTAVTSLFNPALGSLLFHGGVMHRSDFAAYVRQPIPLYFLREGQLCALERAMPDESARHPREVLLALLGGPTPLEEAMGYAAVLPAGLTDADILGLTIAGDTLQVNLSLRAAQAIRDSRLDQGLMARSLTATLCRCSGARRLQVFFGGAAVESLGSEVCWSGDFLCAPNLIDPSGGT